MKKSKIVVALLLAMLMVLTISIAACQDPHECQHKCTVEGCGKCTSDCDDPACKDKCSGHTPAAVDMTEGVYEQSMGSYNLLIKFYDETTYYLQNENSGFRGKYEIKDEQITFSRTQADGSDYNTADHGTDARWETSNKTIYFYQEDGTTPIDYVLNNAEKGAHSDTIIKGTCYAYGTKAHTLAYNEAEDQIQSFKGNYGSRTLKHNKLSTFAIGDEKAIEQARFMVKDLPADAEDGEVKSDYYITLTQKGYETNIPAIRNLDIKQGSFTKNGDVYTLTDTLSGATATLTVTATGATLKKGDSTVELDTWKDSHVVTPTGTPVLTKTMTAALGTGENVSEMQGSVTFYDNGAVTISIKTAGLNVTGSYTAVTGQGLKVTNIGEMTLTQSGLNLVLGGTASVGGRSSAISATITCTQAELAGLMSAPAKTEKLAKSIRATIAGNEMDAKITFYSDGTVNIKVAAVGLDVTGSYTAVTGQGLKVTNIGEMTLTQSGLSLELGGTASVGGKSAPISATITCTQAELAGLMSAPAKTEKLAKDMTVTVSGNELQGKLTFYSDGSVNIKVTAAGLDVTGSYTAVTGQPLTVTNIGNMTLTQSALTLTLGGTVQGRDGQVPISATITCTQAELQGLMA